jgi:GTPase SAR1 family protein
MLKSAGFGVVVTGAPGAGKSTLCYGLYQWFTATNRPCAVINLDPGAQVIPYQEVCQVDVRDLVTVEDLAQQLGPNGALVFAMEHLRENVDWLKEQCLELVREGRFLIFDCPGQIELYTHHVVVKELFAEMGREWNVQLCAVQMVDSHHVADASKYISVLMVCLSAMINLELPMVHVLSKIDLVEQFGKLGKREILLCGKS